MQLSAVVLKVIFCLSLISVLTIVEVFLKLLQVQVAIIMLHIILVSASFCFLRSMRSLIVIIFFKVSCNFQECFCPLIILISARFGFLESSVIN